MNERDEKKHIPYTHTQDQTNCAFAFFVCVFEIYTWKSCSIFDFVDAMNRKQKKKNEDLTANCVLTKAKSKPSNTSSANMYLKEYCADWYIFFILFRINYENASRHTDKRIILRWFFDGLRVFFLVRILILAFSVFFYSLSSFFTFNHFHWLTLPFLSVKRIKFSFANNLVASMFSSNFEYGYLNSKHWLYIIRTSHFWDFFYVFGS